MGYYVHVYECNFRLGKEHFEEAYRRMCKLNDYDELKRGGGGGINGLKMSDPRPEGMNYHPAKWFSWMDADYPSKLNTMEEILSTLGFDLDFNDDGDLIGLSYSDKTGQEDLFLSVLGGLVDDGGFITFKGEEEEDWYRLVFENGKVIEQQGQVQITWV